MSANLSTPIDTQPKQNENALEEKSTPLLAELEKMPETHAAGTISIVSDSHSSSSSSSSSIASETLASYPKVLTALDKKASTSPKLFLVPSPYSKNKAKNKKSKKKEEQKSEQPSAVKHLSYLKRLGENLNEIVHTLQTSDESKKYCVFYQLGITGEIIANQDNLLPKLPNNIRDLLPPQACTILQDIRNNYIVHEVFLLSQEEDRFYQVLKKDYLSIAELGRYINEFCLLNTLNIACSWLSTLNERKPASSFSKWLQVNIKINNLLEIANSIYSLLPASSKPFYSEIIARIQKLHQYMTIAINSDRNQKSAPASTKLFSSTEYKESIQALKQAQEEIKQIPVQECSLDFCQAFVKELKQSASERDEKVLETLRDKHCEALAEILKISSPSKSDLYAARWHVILIYAFIEQLLKKNLTKSKLASTNLFEQLRKNMASFFPNLKKMRQAAIHDFDNSVGYKKEFEQLSAVVKSELTFYIPKNNKRKAAESEVREIEKPIEQAKSGTLPSIT